MTKTTDLLILAGEGRIDKEDIGYMIHWAFSDRDIDDIAKLYNKCNKKTQDVIEYVLNDCNFHYELDLIKNGKWNSDILDGEHSKDKTLKRER